MSVQTQIDRIRGNVANALSAIAAKGVTVPEGGNSDVLAELIEAIEAGGGGGAVAVTGTYVPAETITIKQAYAFEHNAGFVPRIFALWTNNASIEYGLLHSVVLVTYKKWYGALTTLISTCSRGTSSSARICFHYGQSFEAVSTMSFLTAENHNATYAAVFPGRESLTDKSYLEAGKTYYWLAVSDWDGDL